MQTDSINNIESLLPYAIKKGIVLGIGACILVIVVYIVDYSFPGSLVVINIGAGSPINVRCYFR